MKIQKTILSICIALITVCSSQAQVSKADIFDRNTSLTWLGLDFTAAKLLGDREKYGSSSDVKFLIKSWNDLIEREYNKYNIGEAFRKPQVDIKVEVAEAHNEELDVTDMLTNDKAQYLHLKTEDIQEIINTYDFKGMSGLGLMFNVESFNKFEQKAAIWVTFIDLGSKEVLLTERMIEAAGGAGLRNYWARSVFDLIDRVKGKQYEAWRKKYAKN